MGCSEKRLLKLVPAGAKSVPVAEWLLFPDGRVAFWVWLIVLGVGASSGCGS